jgi:hypothetical protein
MAYGTISADIITNSDGFTFGGSPASLRNRIINGAMAIDQRNNGASVTMNGGYTLDRWDTEVSQSSKLSIQQQTSVVPTGFTYAAALTSLSAYSVGSSEVFNIKTIIEGFNCADLEWGTANAKTATLSFWVRSSLTGTFGGAFQNGDNDRAYPFSYTISAANTWEQKTITVSGDTTGTWGKTNGRGIQIRFSLGAGSTFSGTANAWTAGDIRSVSGATSVVGTNGATLYLTGVQLEAGSTATSFDYRHYGTELNLCYRYYYRNKATDANQMLSAAGQCYSTTGIVANIVFPVPMRTVPSALEQTGSAGDYAVWSAGTSNLNCTAVPSFNGATTTIGRVEAIVASGLVAGNATSLLSRATSNAYLGWNAEL